MPTAKFEADFSSFLTGVDAAMQKMNAFDMTAAQTEKTLNTMAADFSGRQLIEEATAMTVAVSQVGGAAKLTAAEMEAVGNTMNTAVEKMKKMGYEVPAGMQALADATKANVTATTEWSTALGSLQGVLGAFGIQATIQGVINFTKEIFNSASEIKKLSDQLDISTGNVQRFQDLANSSGSSLQAIAKGAQTLQEKLGTGDTGLRKALADLNIEWDDLREKNPYDALMTVLEALGKLEDPARRAADGSKALGNSFRELTPAMKTAAEGVVTHADQMEAGTTAALDRTAANANSS